MKTAEQRVAAMHQRSEELSRRRERNILSLTAVLSCFLLALLIPIVAGYAGPSAENPEDIFTAASLLDESAGGYILAALAAFMAGVVITVICVKLRDRNSGAELPAEKKTEPDLNPEEKEI